MKIKLILPILILAMLLFGCIGAQDDSKSFSQFSALKTKYYLTEGFSSNNATMNDYISDLSALRTKTAGSSQKVLDAEIYSARTFFELSKAVSQSAQINFTPIKCSSIEVKNTILSLNNAFADFENAQKALNALNEKELSYLRAGQKEMVAGYGEQITRMKKFFDEKC